MDIKARVWYLGLGLGLSIMGLFIGTYKWRCVQMPLSMMQLLVLLRWQNNVSQCSILVDVRWYLNR